MALPAANARTQRQPGTVSRNVEPTTAELLGTLGKDRRLAKYAPLIATLAGRVQAHWNEMIDRLDRTRESIEATADRDQLIYRNARDQVGAAATTVDLDIGPTPAGCLWIIERLAVTEGAGSAVAFYLNAIEPQNLIEYFSGPIGAWGPTPRGLYVPENQKIVAHFFTQPNNQVCTINARIREVTIGAE